MQNQKKCKNMQHSSAKRFIVEQVTYTAFQTRSEFCSG